MSGEWASDDSALVSAYRRTRLSLGDLWIRYLSLGGNADRVSVDAQLHGLIPIPPGEYNVLAQTINEALDELPSAVRGPKVPLRPLLAPVRPHRPARVAEPDG